MICTNCEKKTVEIGNLKGSLFKWKGLHPIKIGENFNTKICTSCGDFSIKRKDVGKFDEIISHSVTRVTVELLETIAEVTKASDRLIAKKIGITPQYMSEIKTGKKLPSSTLFSLIKLSALHVEDFFKLENLPEPEEVILLAKKFHFVDVGEIEATPQPVPSLCNTLVANHIF